MEPARGRALWSCRVCQCQLDCGSDLILKAYFLDPAYTKLACFIVATYLRSSSRRHLFGGLFHRGTESILGRQVHDAVTSFYLHPSCSFFSDNRFNILRLADLHMLLRNNWRSLTRYRCPNRARGGYFQPALSDLSLQTCLNTSSKA